MDLGIVAETANSCVAFNASENGTTAPFSIQAFSFGVTKKMLVS
jgi:hypothetical protein